MHIPSGQSQLPRAFGSRQTNGIYLVCWACPVLPFGSLFRRQPVESGLIKLVKYECGRWVIWNFVSSNAYSEWVEPVTPSVRIKVDKLHLPGFVGHVLCFHSVPCFEETPTSMKYECGRWGIWNFVRSDAYFKWVEPVQLPRACGSRQINGTHPGLLGMSCASIRCLVLKIAR